MKTQKNCFACKTVKFKSEFSYSAFHTKNGTRCKDCSRLYNKEWKLKNREKVKTQAKNRYYKNPEKYREKTKNFNKKLKEKNPTEYYSRLVKWNLLKYGINKEKYNFISKKQNNMCAICHKTETALTPKSKKIRLLSIDHCHKTGKIRGLLCNRCNPMIGYSQDSIEILQSAIQYLKKNG